ncbi:MAG: hypothetical protein FWD69_19690 [Polyangiaceae bacterium]|nr:hypothetical protein [Polyangiaceae bacterium]
MMRIRAFAALTLVAALVIGGSAVASPDDRSLAEATLKEIEASPKKDVATELVAKSRAALERAAKLRAAGDEPHARLADGLALTWATAAKGALRAVSAEEKAASVRRSANDAGAQADRERALLEESIAQSGRLRAELDKLERESKEAPARTSKSANEPADAGAPKATTKIKDRDAAGDGGAR